MAAATPREDHYPLSGQVALLCEGDLAGYEVALFKRWARNGELPRLDILPAGTGSALFGLSDAVGRERPIFVMEDRDFRTVQEAEDDCKGLAKKRTDRAIRVLGWRAWRRNEIENYFLDDALLLPVMTDAFGCKDADVREAIEQVLRALVPCQAALLASYRVRRAWTRTEPAAVLMRDVSRRPVWDDADGVPHAPDVPAIEAGFDAGGKALAGSLDLAVATTAVAEFQAGIALWSGVSHASPEWRVDWCGKEVLHWLRVTLSARFGLTESRGVRTRRAWSGLNRRAWDEQDRAIEKALQPHLVQALVAALQARNADPDMLAEFDAIAAGLAAWRAPVAGAEQ